MDNQTTQPVIVDMAAEIERLKRENAELKAGPARRLSLKVSAKGALSAYGLGRFPVTLYKTQWETLLGEVENIKAFIEANKAALKVKGEA